MHIIIDMKYDKNGLPFKGYYAEGNLPTVDKMKAVRNQKYFTGGKKGGFFLEIGACDGFKISNTLALERHSWKGIVSEPNPIWHNKLINRKCIVSKKAVFSKSGLKLKFESVEKYPELSGLKQCLEKDNNHE